MNKTEPSHCTVIPPSHPGRPSKLTPAVAAKAVELIELGLTFSQTAEALRVNPSTFHRSRKEKATFCDSIKRAEAAGVAAMLSVIRAATAKSWQAAAWWLERRYPRAWGKVETLNVEARRRAEAEAAGEVADAPPAGLSLEAKQQLIDTLSGTRTAPQVQPWK